MSDNSLATIDLSQLPSTRLGSDEALADLAKSTGYLAYLKLFTKGEAIDTGKIPPGHWGLPQNDNSILDLGDSIDVMPLACRPKAIDTRDKSAVVVSYDETSPEFQRIKADSAKKDSGCQYGISFLVIERTTRRFYELFFGNKSSRPVAGDVFPYLPLNAGDISRLEAAGKNVANLEPHGSRPLTLKVRLAKNKSNQSWHVPSVVKCSTPFTALPTIRDICEEARRFLAPKSNDVEKVQEPAGRRSRAR
jgi:hypothetical protein